MQRVCIFASTDCHHHSLAAPFTCNVTVAAGDYQFEQHMLQITSCQIHTFDCTYKGQSQDKNQRHLYHEWCIGKGGEKYRTWDNITATLGHKQVDLLKMDIGKGVFVWTMKSAQNLNPGLSNVTGTVTTC